jgi:acyl-CoA thioesterase
MTQHDHPADAADAQRVAEATRDAMWKDDRASRMLGMQVVAVGPGTATLIMTVREDMLNGHDICHGGLVTTLADSAFAFACNAYNEVSVAAGFDVNLIAPAHRGDVLTARAMEVAKSGRTGVYDIQVTNQQGPRHGGGQVRPHRCLRHPGHEPAGNADRGVSRPQLHDQGQATGRRPADGQDQAQVAQETSRCP